MAEDPCHDPCVYRAGEPVVRYNDDGLAVFWCAKLARDIPYGEEPVLCGFHHKRNTMSTAREQSRAPKPGEDRA